MTHPSEPENINEPAQLRFLRRLVTTLTVIMVGGVLVVIALLVIRLSDDTSAPRLPAEITLPDGATARAVTFGTGWLAVVTTDDQILILDSETGALRQSVQIDQPSRSPIHRLHGYVSLRMAASVINRRKTVS